MADVIVMGNRTQTQSLYMHHAGHLPRLVGGQLRLGAELHPPLSSCCPTAVGARQDASPLVLSEGREEGQDAFAQGWATSTASWASYLTGLRTTGSRLYSKIAKRCVISLS